MRKAMLILPAVALSVLGMTSTAQAEQAPGCSSTVQIGSTGYVKKGNTTIASVKQFKGCGKNWAYTYVWDSYASKPGGFSSSAAMVVNGDRDFGSNVNGRNKQDVWSKGTNTLTKCTRAYGEVWGDGNVYWGQTDERC
ncbi:hypothetical protein FXN61_34800 [Lentzea sp. PSKA42]|uniref:DUF2690 domain-containing protein n=1 Tax=Lentzea indica TaxID=2604800 RepID=A0ABX1FRQ8_9PSEU|nr:hypothetical protein [Lentzea indica]NKE61652.1 hypothetical protein [Lentzea indica]